MVLGPITTVKTDVHLAPIPLESNEAHRMED